MAGISTGQHAQTVVELAPGIARRIQRSFAQPAHRAARCADEIGAALQGRPGTWILTAPVGSAVLTTWTAAEGHDELWVAAIAWDGEDRRELLQKIWQRAAEASLPVRVALAPDELATVRELRLPYWTTSVFIRRDAMADRRDPLVRPATDADGSFVLDLLRKAIVRGFTDSEPSSGAPVADAVVDALAVQLFAAVRGPDGICLIAADGDHQLGHASGVVNSWDEFGEERLAELHDIFVPPCGRSGLGTVLERAFVDEAFRRGATAVEGHISTTADRSFVPRLLGMLGERGWREHRHLVVVQADTR